MRKNIWCQDIVVEVGGKPTWSVGTAAEIFSLKEATEKEMVTSVHAYTTEITRHLKANAKRQFCAHAHNRDNETSTGESQSSLDRTVHL